MLSYGAPGSAHRLGGSRLKELVERVSREQFHTYLEARNWVESKWGVSYEYKGIYVLLVRLSVRPKVPRPGAGKADPEAQQAWKKRALR